MGAAESIPDPIPSASVISLSALSKTVAALEKKLEIACQEIAHLRLENASLRAENRKLQSENTELRKENRKLRQDNTELRNEVRQIRSASNQSERNTGGCQASNNRATNSEAVGSGDGDGEGGLQLTNKEIYDAACRKYKTRKLMSSKSEQAAGRNSQMSDREWHEDQGSDPAFIPVAERQMDSPLATVQELSHEPKLLSEADKINTFGRSSGFSTTMSQGTRYGFHLVRTIETESYQIATDRNHFDENGDAVTKSIAAGRGELGPENFQVTWEGLANTLIMITVFAVPMERVGLMLGHRYFNARNISRWVRQVAWHLLPIYLYLFRQIAEANVLQMDDTGLYVEEMNKELLAGKLQADCDRTGEELEHYLATLRDKASSKGLNPLLAEVFEEMGRVSPYRNSSQGKSSYHLSCLSWATDLNDTRSTILFFRTHFGSCANLLSRGLEYRASSNKDPLFIIADASSENALDPALEGKIEVFEQGCYHHARRKVKEFEQEDIELASYLLERFRQLDELEWEAYLAPVTREKIAKARSAAHKVWTEIFDAAQAVVRGERHPEAKNFIWKSGTTPHSRCGYIVKHYPELTRYLNDERLKGHNTFVERAFRPIKRIMDAVHCRKTEECQVAFDIIRTIASTAECAGLDLKPYLKDAMNTPREQLVADPARFTPFCKSKNFQLKN